MGAYFGAAIERAGFLKRGVLTHDAKTFPLYTLRRISPFLFSASLLVTLVAFFWRWGQHYIDPDATAYLTLARRWAEGDVARAVNGYWSPLGVWLTAGVMKAGLPVMKAAVVQNTAAAVCFLGAALTLFRRFALQEILVWSLAAVLTVFLTYAVYYQLFDDLWMCAALTASLLLLLREDFLRKPLLWLLSGLSAAVAYYAKAYALPFSFLNIAVCGWMAVCAGAGSRTQCLKMLATVAGIVAVLAFPWWIALHAKYGIWTTGTAGTLNLSWYLIGHQTHQADVGLLLPPPYPDAPYHWEDPWAASSHDLPHFWNSPRLAALQLARVGYTGLKFVGSLAELSGFGLPLWVLGGCLAFSRKAREYFTAKAQSREGPVSFNYPSAQNAVFTSAALRILAVQCLTFPALYFLINFESRYLWYLIPVMMVLGALVLQKAWPLLEKSWLKPTLAAVVAGSFVVRPVQELRMLPMLCHGENRIAKMLRQASIQGPFVSLQSPNDIYLARIAYLSCNAWYCASKEFFTWEETRTEMRRYGIRHLYLRSNSAEWEIAQPRDEAGQSLPEITHGHIPGLRVFVLSPLPPKPSP